MTADSTSIAERALAHVVEDGPMPAERPELGPCWTWTGTHDRHGYGRFFFRAAERVGRGIRGTGAHRIVYEVIAGTIPEGLVLDHLCRNVACCNPAHLEPVTQRTNMLRGETSVARAAAFNTCEQGHRMTDDNVYTTAKRPGKRWCKTCRREYMARYHETVTKPRRAAA